MTVWIVTPSRSARRRAHGELEPNTPYRLDMNGNFKVVK